MGDTVGAVIPLENNEKLVAVVGRRICLVDRETGSSIISYLDLLQYSLVMFT